VAWSHDLRPIGDGKVPLLPRLATVSEPNLAISLRPRAARRNPGCCPRGATQVQPSFSASKRPVRLLLERVASGTSSAGTSASNRLSDRRVCGASCSAV